MLWDSDANYIDSRFATAVISAHRVCLCLCATNTTTKILVTFAWLKGVPEKSSLSLSRRRIRAKSRCIVSI
jgi:hypothetical protein